MRENDGSPINLVALLPVLVVPLYEEMEYMEQYFSRQRVDRLAALYHYFLHEKEISTLLDAAYFVVAWVFLDCKCLQLYIHRVQSVVLVRHRGGDSGTMVLRIPVIK